MKKIIYDKENNNLEQVIAQLRSFLEFSEDAKSVIEIKKFSSIKKDKMMRFYHGVILKAFARQYYLTEGGKKEFSKEDLSKVDTILKMATAEYNVEVINGIKVTIPSQISRMTAEQLYEFIEKIGNYFAGSEEGYIMPNSEKFLTECSLLGIDQAIKNCLAKENTLIKIKRENYSINQDIKEKNNSFTFYCNPNEGFDPNNY